MPRGQPLFDLLAVLLVAACGSTPAAEDAPKSAPAVAREPATRSPAATPTAETFADLTAIDAHLEASPRSVEGHRARFIHHLDRGDYREAHRALNVGLYTLAQADALPPETAWLTALDDRYPPTTRAAEGARLLAMLDDYYSRSPTVDGLLVDYLAAAGETDQLREYLEVLAHEKYADDPRWAARHRELRGAAPADPESFEGAGVRRPPRERCTCGSASTVAARAAPPTPARGEAGSPAADPTAQRRRAERTDLDRSEAATAALGRSSRAPRKRRQTPDRSKARTSRPHL